MNDHLRRDKPVPDVDGRAALPGPGSRPGLSLRGMRVTYGKSQAVCDVDLDVALGTTVALIGANGAGKSTLLKAICGLEPLSSGDVSWKGADLRRTPVWRRAREGIAYANAENRVFGSLSVLENLELGAIAVGRKPAAENFSSVYEIFPRLAERAAQRAGTLSGGEQQMLSIARSLMSRPELLLLDEPGAGLAPIVIAEIAECVARLGQAGQTIVVAEQNLDLVDRLKGTAYLLDRGAIRWTGPIGSLTTTPEVASIVLGEGVFREG
jgi:branched-chain amino acid transport system ATP-binding protein